MYNQSKTTINKLLLGVFCLCVGVITTAYGASKATCTAKQSGGKLNIAKDGIAKCKIVLADDIIEAERTAADELADYLKKVTGAEFTIKKESQNKEKKSCIYVGQTKYAQEHGINLKALGSEQWIMRTVDGNLILSGGRTRGTLYAVYHFLEDIVGVHWWSPWDEHVPSTADLSVAELDRKGTPAFKNRGVWDFCFWKRAPAYVARNRINRYADTSPISAKYGGGFRFGRPRAVHSEFNYIMDWNKDGTLAKHPEWMRMEKGKRTVVYRGKDRLKLLANGLCLSNMEMRKAFLHKLKGYIRESRTKPIPPMIFDVSLSDSPTICDCPSCQAIDRKYGNRKSGLVTDFTNYLADGIKDDYPGVMLHMLAYQTYESAPVGILPRDNVIVMLCDTKSNITVPLPSNGPFAKKVKDWGKISDNVYIWDYHINQYDYTPAPFGYIFQPDLQFLHEKGATGYHTDYGSTLFSELSDMRLWLLVKLLEDPYQDDTKLIKTFTDGYYGPAGVHIRRYIKALSETAKAHPSYMNVRIKLAQSKYLTPEFLHQAQDIFNDAEETVAGSEEYLARVRHARLALDRACLGLFPKIMGQWLAEGKKADDLWLNRDKVSERLRDTVKTECKRRVHPESMHPYFKTMLLKKKKRYFNDINKWLQRSALVINPPSKFTRMDEKNYTAFAADSIGLYGNAKMLEDKRTQNGIAVRAELTDDQVKGLDGSALRWSIHNRNKSTKENKAQPINSLKIKDIIPGRGYHWYKLNTSMIREGDFLWLYGANLAVDLRDAQDILTPTRKFELWASVKFEGPYFKNRTDKKTNAISVEWVVAKKKVNKGIIKNIVSLLLNNQAHSL